MDHQGTSWKYINNEEVFFVKEEAICTLSVSMCAKIIIQTLMCAEIIIHILNVCENNYSQIGGGMIL